MNKKPLKANLFRFVTLRNPQLIAEEDKDLGFVFYPSQSKSAFHPAVEGLEDDAKAAALAPVAAGFNALATKGEVRLKNVNLHRFAGWLMRHKNTLDYPSIYSAIQEVNALTTTAELQLWDNLIYQTIERKSLYVREALIQMLVANKFVKAFQAFADKQPEDLVFTDEQLTAFSRRAHASVVIDQAIFGRATGKRDSRLRASKIVRKAMDLEMQAVIATEEVAALQELAKSLQEAAVVIEKEDQNAYQTAQKAYDAAVKTLIKEAVPVIKEEVDPKTGETTTVETYPELDIPDFTFEAAKQVDAQRLETLLPAAALQRLQEGGFEKYETFEAVQKAIAAQIETAQSKIVPSLTARTKKVRVGGATLMVDDRQKVPAADYNISALRAQYPVGGESVFMQIYDEVNGAQIIEADYSIAFDDGTTYAETDFDVIDNTSLILKMFPDRIVFPQYWKSYTIEGVLTLDDGRTLTFNKQVYIKNRLNLGNFEVGQDDSLPQKPAESRQVFGVTNLGIADFRRVEQEVCCYVPGEVSHIENVLAREYKERETRNLLSQELIDEQTTERELENLTDTSTTSRFEMQSEASAVLTEDQATDAGANAGVNGGLGKNFRFYADAFFNTSSASSSSNSNSEAQTYAEEVTERALERVVEKVSRKRTSRVLREYEETNKHGFDNTEGDSHITGVYRWVDKIYNNSLVNYGKRLMYEFAIPEPSRFFKEAVYAGMNGDVTTTVEEVAAPPLHPSTFGINSASDIALGSYRTAAGYYNAPVDADPQDYISVSDAFSVIGNQYLEGHRTGASNFKMDIPDGYEATSAFTTLGFTYVPNAIEDTYCGITVGDKYSAIEKKRNDKLIRNYVFTTPVKKELGIALHGTDVGGASIGIVAKCRRTPESFRQWQNDTFTTIMTAYEDKLAAYNDQQTSEAFVTPVAQDRPQFNPGANRAIEKKELKRIAIELMTEGLSQPTAQDNYDGQDPDTGRAPVKKGTALQSHIATVKFFEQAFDWDIMAYLFYPYFYAAQKNWKSIYQETEAADPIFQAFLQSGMARAVVPVRPGFEQAVNWFMETGELWEGEGLVVGEATDRYLSIAEELETTEGVVEKTWESRVPTALTIVQAESAALIEGGLPCFCPEETQDSTIQASDKILGNKQDSDAEASGAVIPDSGEEGDISILPPPLL